MARVPERADRDRLRLVPPIPVEETTTPALWPTPLTPLVGRAREIEILKTMLADDSIRLVTLTGPGGVGKSRLALEVASQLSQNYPDGVEFVALASIIDSELVPAAIARSFDIRESGDRTLPEQLFLELRNWQGLLLLDNFEQVIRAASFITDLLQRCPRLKVLITSRIVLHHSGEHELAVPPLALPSGAPTIADAERSEAVTLFLQRAIAVRSGFELTPENVGSVVEICRRLDGLPLAIELAAARSKLLSPPALLTRLSPGLELLTGGPRDQPARLRTMRAAISWSHDLLTEADRTLFRRLAVFTGGFGLEAAEIVGSTQQDGFVTSSYAVFDGVASLLDNSLLRHHDGPNGEPRFDMLEPVREFGIELLAASDEEADIRQRHARHFLGVVQAAEPPFVAFVHPVWLDRLQVDHPNLRQALGWFSFTGSSTELLQMAGSLAWFWYVRAHLAEGMNWLNEALTRDNGESPAARAKALFAKAWMVRFNDEQELAISFAEESLALYRSIDDEAGIAQVIGGLGTLTYGYGDFVRTTRLGEETLQLGHKRADNMIITLGLNMLGLSEMGQREYRKAEAHFERALSLQRKIEDHFGVAHSLGVLGNILVPLGEYERAVEFLRESLSINWRTGNKTQAAWSLYYFARLAAALEQPELAARLVGAETALRTSVGALIPPSERAEHDEFIVQLRGRLGDGKFDNAFATGSANALENAVNEALAITVSPPKPAMKGQSNPATPFGLSEREQEVMVLLIAGRTDREIAGSLFISPRTVQGHIASIFSKFGVNTRTAAVTAALRAGFVLDAHSPDRE